MIEAGWLLALAVVPVVFNPLSHRVFEPEKMALLQLLCLVMAAAWSVKVGFGGRLWRPCADSVDGAAQLTAVRWLAVATAIGIGASAVLSVDRGLSWAGSYERAQGVWAELAYLTLFLLTLGHLRTSGQWGRVVRVLIVASLPIALYAIAQHLGVDPWSWQAGTARASSTLGNPIFLGGYLVMALFLTGHELVDRVGLLAAGAGGAAAKWHSILHVGCLLYIAAAQWVALLWTYSRGPLLGFAAGLLVVLVLVVTKAVHRPQLASRGRTIWWWTGLAPALVLLAVGGLSLRWVNTPSQPSERGPARRLTRVLDPESRTARFRLLMGSAVLDRVMANRDLDPESGAARPAPFWRPWTGSGQETLALTIGPHLSPGIVQLDRERTVFDRAHNETLQRLATEGILGAGLQIAWTCFLWGSLVLAMAPGSGGVGRYWIPPTVAAVAAAAAVGFSGTAVWGPLAAAAGLVAGTATIAWWELRKERGGGSADPSCRRSTLAAAVLAALIAHFIETSFGVAVTVTNLYFWFLGAVAVLLGRGRLAVEPDPVVDDAVSPRRESWVDGLLAGSVFAALLFGFAFSRWSVLSAKDGWGPGPAMAWRLAALALLAAMIFLATSHRRTSRSGGGRSIVAVSVGAVVPMAVYGAVQWLRVSGPWAPAASEADPSHAVVESLASDFVVFAVLLLSLLLLLGVALGVPRGATLGRAGTVTLVALCLLTLAVPVILRPLRADVFAAQSLLALDRGEPEAAAALAAHAVELAPRQDAYLALHAAAASRAAAGSGGSLEPALASLSAAAALRPLDGGHAANLARGLVQMGDAAESSARRSATYARARREYERALRLQPWSARTLAGLGGLLRRTGDGDAGCARLREAVALDPSSDALTALLGGCPGEGAAATN